LSPVFFLHKWRRTLRGGPALTFEVMVIESAAA